ncbi:MAG: methylated-DNA--[protein]-cysteine S-methyltransferase [Phycisphaerales bacterium]
MPTPSPILTATTIQSPVGELTVASITDVDGPRVCLVEFGHRAPAAMDALATMFDADIRPSVDPPECPALSLLMQELAAYFVGDLRRFTVPLELAGTAFQTAVWQGLLGIAYGTTIGYGDLARAIGKDAGASRAVGAANGANRLAVVVPCHRVVAADGGLHGYGGGLERKRWLLDHERTVAGGLFAAAQRDSGSAQSA